eukprot:TRINITY_DN24773_c0_g1_i1.p1 TRINITY_DN24773_c0_g1~~TRINITY_DN24773_c0_g1_i1.p1  ORF type:complete len:145 (+),score=29.77 TRINITY_DN24773_c0_g1_i1:1-435(+)
MGERRKGDNYSAFEKSEDFFEAVQRSALFKEETNQMDMEFRIDLIPQKMKLDLTLRELGIILPHQTLVIPLSLLAKISAAPPRSSIKLPPPNVAVDKPADKPEEQTEEPKPADPGKPFSFEVNARIQGVHFISPINVFFVLIFS